VALQYAAAARSGHVAGAEQFAVHAAHAGATAGAAIWRVDARAALVVENPAVSKNCPASHVVVCPSSTTALMLPTASFPAVLYARYARKAVPAAPEPSPVKSCSRGAQGPLSCGAHAPAVVPPARSKVCVAGAAE
jgi:hypothetical protein